MERPWTSSRPRARVLQAPILEARDEARELVLAAEAHATELIAEAEHAAEQIRATARESGRDEGLLYAQRLLVEIQQTRIRTLEGGALRRSVSELALEMTRRLLGGCWSAEPGTWARALLDDGSLAARAEREITWLAMARALSVSADANARARARALLDQALRVTHDEGRMGAHIDALALLALSRWRQGDHVAAMTTLERALRLAEPEGYVRLFADYGLPMARLLHEARRRGVMPDYVGAILEAYGASATGYPTVASTPPERLSDRECEVLRHLAAGLTNREIADALVISPETVKKHTSSIYAKLSVGNRTEAATRARELNLLG